MPELTVGTEEPEPQRYFAHHLPCGCPVRLAWLPTYAGDNEVGHGELGRGQGRRRCRIHRQTYAYSLMKMRLAFGPTQPDLSGDVADAFLVTWTPLKRWKIEQTIDRRPPEQAWAKVHKTLVRMMDEGNDA
jgi:hypothetical protein